ncbi:MAG: hypothetical protein MUO26_13845 [Methanotrichaceae archaeon]|nr:hypothetical protein [Methanotrichaceae archaeon]
MICLRCGYCCISLDAVIANPGSIKPDGSLEKDDTNAMIFKPSGQMCPHLIFQGIKAICSIHNLLCYEGTPCQQFDQFGSEDNICILGSYFKDETAKTNLA